MRTGILGLTLTVALAACAPAAQAPVPQPAAPAQPAGAVPAPAEVIGFDPGEDHKLADYTQLLAYYEALAASSDRVEMVEIGRTTRGLPMVLLYISTPENLAQLDRWKEISQRLGRAEG